MRRLATFPTMRLNVNPASSHVGSTPPSAPPLQPIVMYFARLGDMVMLTALLDLLHRRYHEPCHVIGVGSWTTAVYQGNPDVAQVWSFDRHFPFPLTSIWPRVARVLKESHPGPIYICEHHYRQLPRIRRMLAFSGVDPARCIFMTEEPQTLHHSVDRLVRLGEQTPRAPERRGLPRAHPGFCLGATSPGQRLPTVPTWTHGFTAKAGRAVRS